MGDFSLTNIVRPFGLGPAPTPKPKLTIPPPAPSEATTTSGLTVITGGGGQVIALNHSHTMSTSRTIVKEKERTYDKLRVKNPDDKEQHVDVEALVKMSLQSGERIVKMILDKQKESENVEILEQNKVRKASS